MTTTTGTTTDRTTSPPADVAAAALERGWLAWRAARHAGLRAPRGVLSITAHHWLGPDPAPLPGIPGEWWSDADGAHVRATPGGAASDGAASDGTARADVLVDAETLARVAGMATVVVAEAGSTLPFLLSAANGPAGGPEIAADLVAVEVALRTGRHLVRLRDPGAPALARAAVADPVESFPFDPARVLEVPVRWYAAPRPDQVDGARPGLVHRVRVVGEAQLDGTTLRLVAGHGGGVTLAFTDRAPGVPEWRAVHVPDGDVAASRTSATTDADGELLGVLSVDLNRATAYPSHFNDHGTCPRPLAGNDLPFAVEAGEKDPR